MDKNEIPDDVWDSAITIVDGAQRCYRMDKIWKYLNSMINPDGTHRFHPLAEVAKFTWFLFYQTGGSSALLLKTRPHFNPI